MINYCTCTYSSTLAPSMWFAVLRMMMKRALPETLVEDCEFKRLIKVVKRAPASYLPPSKEKLGKICLDFNVQHMSLGWWRSCPLLRLPLVGALLAVAIGVPFAPGPQSHLPCKQPHFPMCPRPLGRWRSPP